MRRSSGIAFVAREIAAMAGASVEERQHSKRARRERKERGGRGMLTGDDGRFATSCLLFLNYSLAVSV